ncbi:YpoC family protein [Neobacillus fumarioli]|uniref:YpoC family protein n=1 Tax=Neobacillus fumarioli TaxID=105229 RepID=UPI00082B6702|nr:hypothetical protein [Neobacillus fumarioli]
MDAASILEEWKTVKDQLEDVFRRRDLTNVKTYMDKGIELFKQLLALTNDKTELPPFDQLVYKPVNLAERFEFIMNRPNLYHSFRQLSELMKELEKLYVKNNVKKQV